jgi:hypothetical protein
MLISKLAGCWHLAAGLLLLLPAIAQGQTVTDGDTNSTAKVQAGLCPTAVAVNQVTNKIHVANFGQVPPEAIPGHPSPALPTG